MMKSGIYQIRNLVNGNRYIGSAKNLSSRKRQHLSDLHLLKHRNSHLQYAWNKYGEDVFEFQVIEYCYTEDLITLEQIWINKFDFENLYNINPIARSRLGSKMSEQQKEAVSVFFKGRKLTEDHKKKISSNHARSNKGQRNGNSTTSLWKYRKEDGLVPNWKGSRQERFCTVCGKPVKEKYNKNGKFLGYTILCGDAECRSSICRANTALNIKKFEPKTKETKMLMSKGKENWWLENSREHTFKNPEGIQMSTKQLKTFCIENNLNYNSMKCVSNGNQKAHQGWTKA